MVRYASSGCVSCLKQNWICFYSRKEEDSPSQRASLVFWTLSHSNHSTVVACSQGVAEPRKCSVSCTLSSSSGECCHQQKTCCRAHSLFDLTMDLTAETCGCFQPRVMDKSCSFILEKSAFVLLPFHPPCLAPTSLDT